MLLSFKVSSKPGGWVRSPGARASSGTPIYRTFLAWTFSVQVSTRFGTKSWNLRWRCPNSTSSSFQCWTKTPSLTTWSLLSSSPSTACDPVRFLFERCEFEFEFYYWFISLICRLQPRRSAFRRRNSSTAGHALFARLRSKFRWNFGPFSVKFNR